MTETPSIRSTAVEVDDTKYIIAFGVSGGFFLMFVILVTTVLLLLSRRHQQNRGTYSSYLKVLTVGLPPCPSDDVTVTDHIPVDDNPVYITMKRIDMNKNSAYETVHLELHITH